MSYNLRSEEKDSPKTYHFHNYAFPSFSQTEKSSTQIMNISDLKKITPRVKVLNQETPTLQANKKMSPNLKSKTQLNTSSEGIKNEMKKYCRTCASIKYPLVDIFSEKGLQMKLNLQIKHLENVRENDSLSTQMCMDCICDLKMSYTFFVQIKKAEIKLKSIETKLSESDESTSSLIHHDPQNLRNNGPRIAAVFSTNPVDWDVESQNSNLNANTEESGSKGKLSPEESVLKGKESGPKGKESGPKGKLKSEESVLKGKAKSEESGLKTKANESGMKTKANESGMKTKANESGMKTKANESGMKTKANESGMKTKANESELKTKLKTEIESDNESIEEFDPDDPPFHPESDDDLDSDGEPKKILNPFKKTLKKLEGNNFGDGKMSDSLEASPEKIEREKSQLEKEKSEQEKEMESLKRKLPAEKTKPEAKIRKFNVNDALNIKTEEDGVMYVTVRGENPNELLLVKVKKMDKGKPAKKADYSDRSFEEKGQIIEDQIEQYKKKREIVLGPQAKERVSDVRIKKEIESVETKRRSSDQMGLKASEIQQVLGLKQVSDLIGLNKTKTETKAESKLGSKIEGSKVEGKSRKADPKGSKIDLKCIKLDPEGSSLDQTWTVDDSGISGVSGLSGVSGPSGVSGVSEMQEVQEIKEVKLEKKHTIKDKKKPVEVKMYNNADDYNRRIESLTSKWEDKQRKDWEEINPGSECPLDRMKRVLGDLAKDENLHEFMDNLQQRKMIIAKLTDEDILSLFKERLATRIFVKQEVEDFYEEETEESCLETFECDFCFSEFPSKEVNDEHMKFHDIKFQYFCEDCSEEFQNLRLKKNHNVICIRKLICKYCDLMLDSKGKKKQHEQKHCDNLFGQLCEFCGEKFKHQGTLDQHVKTKHMTLEKTFQCPKCPKKFAFKTKLSFHLKSVHTALRAYLCEDCGADFKNPASLRHHRIRKHLPIGNKRECPVCRKMIPFYSLSKHMHTHKAYTIKCPHCDKMFKNSSTLKQHVRIHEDQRQFRCDTCGVGFNRRDGLRLHMKVHQKSDSRGLKECSCQVCGEKFPNHSMLVIHRNRIHKDGRNYTCHICNRSMISTRSLEWHLAHIHNEPLPGVVKVETSTGSETKRVSCFHCHKTFKTEMILRTHIKNSHMEKEPVKCLDCEETFLSEVRLRHHMMVAHNRLEGTLQCPHCPKRFVNQLRLKTHMIAHSEERPFQCDICGFNLKTKIQLIKHHQNRHSDERPLQCRYCPWRCKQVSALVCHERTHTNERPYSCSVCRQRFKYLGDKNKHERRHESLGGSGFKRIVTNRGPKKTKTTKGDEEDYSNSEQEQMEEEHLEEQLDEDEMEAMGIESRLVDMTYEDEENVKIEEKGEIIDAVYQEEFQEISKEETEVIMNMEDTTVYTEEVTAENIENIETAHIIEDDLIANQILQSGTVVHIEQQDEEGKIQVIPVVLSLPDLTENSEVDLATTSIMYNNEEE